MKIKNILLVTISSLVLVACGSGGDGLSADANAKELPVNVQAAIDAPKSNLSQELKDALTYMYSEESLAHDLYLEIHKKQAQKQLENIATRSEVKHIKAVNELAKKYDLNMTKYPDTEPPYSIDGIQVAKYPVEPIQELYDALYDKGIQSAKDALEVGCMVEVTDIDDLNKYIKYALDSNADDVKTIFEFLRDGSYNHYWAFDKGLKKIGVSDGCCSLGTINGVNYCHNEYPKNSKAN